MVAEIVRTTSYKGAALRIIDKPWNTEIPPDNAEAWRLVRLEILVTQLFLYFDDYEVGEREELAMRLFALLLSSESGRIGNGQDAIETLGCLACFLLGRSRLNARKIVPTIRETLFASRPCTPALLGLGVWLRDTFDDWKACVATFSHEYPNPYDSDRIHDLVFFAFHSSRRDDVPLGRYATLKLIHALGDYEAATHTALLRVKLIDAMDTLNSATCSDVLRDLEMLQQALHEYSVSNALSIGFGRERAHNSDRADLAKLALELDAANHLELSKTQRDSLQFTLEAAFRFLFSGERSLAARFQNSCVMSLRELESFLNLQILTRKNWESLVETKRAQGAELPNGWLSTSNGVMPSLLVTFEDNCHDSNAWAYVPAEARKMIEDHVGNVVHCDAAYEEMESDPHMKISLSVQENFVQIRLRNRGILDGKRPSVKPSERVFASHVFGRKRASDARDVAESNEVEVLLWLPRTDALSANLVLPTTAHTDSESTS